MPGYRPPSTAPAGDWARAIHAKGRAENLNQTARFEALGPKLGLGPKSRSAYIALDLGRRAPRPEEEPILLAWLGDFYPPEPEGPASEGAGPYLERIDRLVALVSRLLDERPPAPPADIDTRLNGHDLALAGLAASIRELQQVGARPRRTAPDQRAG